MCDDDFMDEDFQPDDEEFDDQESYDEEYSDKVESEEQNEKLNSSSIYREMFFLGSIAGQAIEEALDRRRHNANK